MLTLDDDQNASRIFACPQCPKIFATRSNLKRHMENPNIHNIPYVRSRDQKRWKGHSKKVVSKEETTESNNDRMRKWRAENREKNRQNDLRCRVYRLARQKYGDHDSADKQAFVREEIARRLGRRMMMERRESNGWAPPIRMRDSLRLMSPVLQYIPQSSPSSPTSPSSTASSTSDIIELPFYSAPQQKIELPSLDRFARNNSWSSSPPDFSSASSSPVLPHLSPSLQRRTSSSSSTSSVSSVTSDNQNINNNNKKRCRSSSYHSTTPVPTSKKLTTGSSKAQTAAAIVSTTKTTKTAKTAVAVAQKASAMSFVKVEDKKAGEMKDDFCVLPSMHAFLSYNASSSSSSTSSVGEQKQQQKQHQEQCCIPTITTKGGIKYVDSNKILDEFVGVVLNYVDNATVAQ